MIGSSTSRPLGWLGAAMAVAVVLQSLDPFGPLPPAVASASSQEPSVDDSRRGKTGTVRGTFTSHQRLLTRGATSQRDVVVYLRSTEEEQHAPPQEPAVVTQKQLQFHPHVLPLLRGTPIRFVNEDGVDHNVFSTEECCAIDLDMPPHTTKEITALRDCVASVVCRLHPEMSLWIVVLDNPWFAHVELEKDKQGDVRIYSAEYSIRDVPPGTYALTFWNKKLRPMEFPVVVKPDSETVQDVVIEE